MAGTSSELAPLLLVNSATLAGTLDVELVNGFVPVHGQSFTLLSSVGTIAGMFETINLPHLTGPMNWSIANSGTTLTLTATPEPGGLAAVAIGGFGLLARRRARRR